MVGGNNNSSLKWFSSYRDENIAILTRLKNILNYIAALNKLDDYEKKELLGFVTSVLDFKFSAGVSGKNAAEQLFQTINYHQKELTDILNPLIAALEEENEEITKYLGQVRQDVVEFSNELVRRLVSFQQTQQELYSKLSKKILVVKETQRKLITEVDKTLKEMGDSFISFYNELEQLIQDNAPKKEIFQALSRTILYLERVIGNLKTMDRETEEGFLDTLFTNISPKKELNAHKFASNFFRAGRGIEITRELQSLMQQVDNKAFTDLESDLQKKVETFVESQVKTLFKGIEEVSDALDETESKSKLKEITKEYEPLRKALLQKIADSKDYKFAYGTPNTDKLFIEEGITFEQFEKDYLSKDTKVAKELAAKILERLQAMIASKDDKGFKQFMDHQASVAGTTGIQKKGDSDDDGGDLSSSEKRSLREEARNYFVNFKSAILPILNEGEEEVPQEVVPFLVEFLSYLMGEIKDSKSKKFERILKAFEIPKDNYSEDIKALLDITKSINAGNQRAPRLWVDFYKRLLRIIGENYWNGHN